MANKNSALDQLKSFLNELFQFDSQDLDFGVYKILHYKRKEIKDFIDKLLVDKVQEQLQTLTSEESKKATEQLKELEKDEFIQGWINANDEERKVAEKLGKQKIAEYKRIKTQVTEAKVSGETENHIYNHLTLFFSRYYDKGDFISKRRFGKNEKYMVPYNGEETHFYWANHDQYYIKSSETFQQYAFKIPTPQDNMVVNFKLTSAQLEQGNVKADETNFFILSEKEAEIGEKETNFFFEYRPLTDDEKKTFKGNNKQDILDERTFEALKNKYGKEVNLVKLWETDKDNKALLLKKINHYTRKNKYDFFIHKNLKGFLQRELDYYIKSELINVDDLYVTEVDSYFDRLKHNVKTIKVFKNIADTIIDFVSQIEDFQKKLWEKKKFVLSTEWVITIDRLVEYIGAEAAKPILEEVIKNEKQVAEWKELFGEENVPKKLSIDALKADLHSWRKLPIDTVHFSKEFMSDILNLLSENIDIEKENDGFVLQSDNSQALDLIKNSFENKISATYIDPPYNTGDDEFIYKDAFKSSTWLTMFYPLLNLNKELLIDEGSLFVSCDEHEELTLGQLLSLTFGKNNQTEKITWNKRIPKNDKGIGNIHEYVYLYSKNSSVRKNKELSYVMRKDSLEEVYELVKKAKSSGKDLKETQNILKKYYKKQGFDRGITLYCELDKNYEIWGKINMSWPNAKTTGPRYEVINPVTNKPAPIPNRGWRWKEATFENAMKGEEFILPDGSMMKGRIWFANNENTQPSSITYLKEVESFLLRSIISQKSDGSITLENLGLSDIVNYPKPVKLIEYLLYSSSLRKGYFLDYFSGSGTTYHAVQNLNNQDNEKRKCVLIEQGGYVSTVIIPRVKKIAHSLDWSTGKPVKPTENGLGVFLKYQKIEQYEEALENIAFTANKDAQQQALEFDQYIPKYMLEFETKNSQTLVNTEAMKDPWDYKLKVWDGFTYDTEQAVDLVETFNYLIGLHMQKCITKEINGNKYQFVYGHNNANKNILAVWRSVKDWKIEDYKADSEALKAELKNYTYDLLYINEQAHIEGYQPIEEVFKNKMLP